MTIPSKGSNFLKDRSPLWILAAAVLTGSGSGFLSNQLDPLHNDPMARPDAFTNTMWKSVEKNRDLIRLNNKADLQRQIDALTSELHHLERQHERWEQRIMDNTSGVSEIKRSLHLPYLFEKSGVTGSSPSP